MGREKDRAHALSVRCYMEPDYKSYTYEELVSALDSIDKEKWPERVREIRWLLNSKKHNSRRVEIEKSDEGLFTYFANVTLGFLFGLLMIFIMSNISGARQDGDVLVLLASCSLVALIAFFAYLNVVNIRPKK